MHWPAAFKSGSELFPRDDAGQVIWEGGITVLDVSLSISLSLFLFLLCSPNDRLG